MEITIIGSGNVAAALAGAVAGQDSLHLKQLCARNPLRGRENRRPVRSRIHCPTGGDGRGRPLPDSRQRFGGGRGFRTAAHASRRHGSPYLRRARHRFAAVRRRPGRMLSAANLFGGTQHRFPHRPPLHRIHHRPGRPHRPGLRGGALRLCPRSRQRPTWQTPRSGSLRM